MGGGGTRTLDGGRTGGGKGRGLRGRGRGGAYGASWGDGGELAPRGSSSSSWDMAPTRSERSKGRREGAKRRLCGAAETTRTGASDSLLVKHTLAQWEGARDGAAAYPIYALGAG